MPKKIRFETDEDTSEEVVEEIEISSVKFPQPKSSKDQIRRIQDLMRDSDKEPKSILGRAGVVINTRKGVGSVGKPTQTKKANTSKSKKIL